MRKTPLAQCWASQLIAQPWFSTVGVTKGTAPDFIGNMHFLKASHRIRPHMVAGSWKHHLQKSAHFSSELTPKVDELVLQIAPTLFITQTRLAPTRLATVVCTIRLLVAVKIVHGRRHFVPERRRIAQVGSREYSGTQFIPNQFMLTTPSSTAPGLPQRPKRATRLFIERINREPTGHHGAAKPTLICAPLSPLGARINLVLFVFFSQA